MPDTLRIYHNGQIVQQDRRTPQAEALLGHNYVYAAINTVHHRPLYAGRQLEYAVRSFERLYGRKPTIYTDGIIDAIPALLAENRMPKMGNVTHVFLVPGYGEKRGQAPDIIITTGEPIPYSGYELLSLRPKAVVANYGLPFAGHRTAVSLTTAQYMDEFAARSEAHMALRSDRDGNLISAGDYPVYVVCDGKVYTPSRPDGTGSVEHELMEELCRMADVALEEQEIACCNLTEAEEIMVFTATGIRSLLSCGGVFLYNLIALKLEKYLPHITRGGLL